MSNKITRVGISQGDINGIAYELILKTFEDSRMYELCMPVLFGSSKALAFHRKAMELPQINTSIINDSKDIGSNRLNIVHSSQEEVAVELSKPTEAAKKIAYQAVDYAINELDKRNIDVLVTTPSTIEECSCFEKTFNKKPLEILVHESFRIALATGKIPLSEVPASLSIEGLSTQLKTLHEVLIKDFMITTPRIAVLSFNPGISLKEQTLGVEEKEIIIPAIEQASSKGVICFGPYAADNFFASDEYMKFDAVLAMYYDQGVISFRSITGDEGVHYYANLPYVITSPDQDVSFEKAGTNTCSPDSMRQAIYLALNIHKNRIIDHRITANPLRKQYFERGSDNEKLDLTKEED
ncbi:4-hydroxythreonine-4-phosphate dehydrogenase PdxA [Bacteroidales bacterium OttesenSCG-928-M11]|nr:4-hydroxythreonine-4-phosphate dehydrogenase PdxA [Bacteroidales bacterium OttesenSCG-928-M11]